VDEWVDERLDPEKSTAAAAAYLRDLYQQFGSWLLAKAAYNAGQMRVLQAIRSVGSTDFWTLASSQFLQQETKEFVPAIHAATVIGQDPTRFGFEPNPPEAVAVETVRVPPGTVLARVATAAGLPVEALRDLNPVLIRGSTPPDGPFDLRVPAHARGAVAAAVAPPPRRPARRDERPAPSPGVHVVRPRETLTGIARQHDVSVADLVRWNALSRSAVIRPGDRLRVTERDANEARATAARAPSPRR
jgi:membrane-bound lytic murein transglycosylase D